MYNLTNVLTKFTEEINNFMFNLKKSNSVITVLGDFNIDLLQINKRPAIREYLDNWISQGMFPEITLPTHLTDYSATLIDNAFSNCYDSETQSSGILLSDISDHFPYFCTLPNAKNFRNLGKKVIYC